jgi:outer membrane protein
MKKLIPSLLSIAALAVAPVIRAETPPVKLVVVDMAKIFDSHYETQAEKAKLDDASQKAQAEIDRMNKEGNALVAEYKEFDEQSKSSVATADAKSKALADAQKKQQEINTKMQDINTFANNARSTIQQRIQTFRSMMMDEISKTVKQVAQRHDATLVVDKSGPSLLGIAPVIYADPAYDITDEVMAEINKGRPANVPAASSSTITTPAAAGSPAAAPSEPKITVPGVTPSK